MQQAAYAVAEHGRSQGQLQGKLPGDGEVVHSACGRWAHYALAVLGNEGQSCGALHACCLANDGAKFADAETLAGPAVKWAQVLAWPHSLGLAQTAAEGQPAQLAQ